MKKRFLVFGYVAGAMLLSVLLTTSRAQAAPPPPDDTDAENFDYMGQALAHGDFNGDGYEDLAVGVDGESIGDSFDQVGAGAVEVIYGSSSGLEAPKRQFLRQGDGVLEDKPEFADSLGNSLAAGDFNGDGYDDLAIGVPFEDVGSVKDAGALNVLYGSASGLSTTVHAGEFWHQDTPGVEDAAEASDKFGRSLAVGDFNGDGWDDLAIGVPGEQVLYASDEGLVQVLQGSPSGLSTSYVYSQIFDQYPDWPEAGDLLGLSLAAGDFDGNGFDDLAIGVELEDLRMADEGAVNILYGSGLGLTYGGAQFWHQDVAGVEGAAWSEEFFGSSLDAGDFNADGRDDIAIGVPRDIGPAGAQEGAVNVIYGSSAGLSVWAIPDQLWCQDIPGGADIPDKFGSSLAVADFNGDKWDDVAIGVPTEDVATGPGKYEGAAYVIYGSAVGLNTRILPGQLWHQDAANVEDSAGQGDLFAFAVTAGDFNADGQDDLAVGVPQEDLESAGGPIGVAGAVNVIYGFTDGLNATAIPDQFWTQVFISPPLP